MLTSTAKYSHIFGDKGVTHNLNHVKPIPKY